MFGFFKKELAISRWFRLGGIIFFILALLGAGAFFIFERQYAGRVFPGVRLGDLDLGGQTAEEAAALLNKRVDEINQEGFSFVYDGQRAMIPPVLSSTEADAAYDLVDFNTENAVSEAMAFGRQGDTFQDLSAQLSALFTGQQITAATDLDEGRITKLLEDAFGRYNTPAQDARLIVEKEGIAVEEERMGKVIDFKKGLEILKKRAASLDAAPIKLTLQTDYPKILKKDCQDIGAKASRLLSVAPLALRYGDKKWIINKETLLDWLILKTDDSGVSDKVMIGFDEEKVRDYLDAKIGPSISQKPMEAKFEMKDGRVVQFQAGQAGLEIDFAASIQAIKAGLDQQRSDIDLVTRKVDGSIQAGELDNNFGIKEIIGTGQSNFRGSPANRRHNIKVGADTLNGVLIKPGEEFSLLGALGKIDGSTGYLPELVIKDNKTIPEFGGGLCQIGTTMFRAALSSGLPITERRNHSYRVAYYEPAGTDATIYDPSPDFKFINDTGNYILIQARIEGDDLYFDFWGTKDGRISERTDPTIYNIVKPEPPKMEETLDLPVGKKKCTERAHNGADAYFNYKVTYPDGEVKQKRFSSHYVPWREVCLIGVEKLSTPDSSEASSTPQTASTTSAR